MDFNFNFDFSGKGKSRYITMPNIKPMNERLVKYSNAEKLAKDMSGIKQGERAIVLVDGSFIFGDFIEAFIVNYNMKVDEMTISTLSMSENNIYSLALLINKGYVQKLNIVTSTYFYSHEKHNLVKMLYRELDKDNKFQLAFADVHTKICFFRCADKYYNFFGSANLRSSQNIEQFSIENNRQIYDFNKQWHDAILEKYATINKSIRGKDLWQKVVMAEEGAEVQKLKKEPQKHKPKTKEILRQETSHFKGGNF